MEGLTIETFLSIMVPLTLYFLITLTGSFLSDMVNSITKKDKKFRLGRILSGAIFGAFVMLALEKPLLGRFQLEQVVLIAFIMGAVSFELFTRVSKLDTLMKYIKMYQEVKKQVSLPEKTLDSESKNSDTPRGGST